GQKYSEPATASILMSMESVFAMIAGMVILHERLTLREGMGCLVMFAAVVLVQLPEFRTRREAAQTGN
ncbi:MAG: DMT family transporter, partial [Spirochaetales bacterium]|nr:DMT family transporter [Spirochaetales bacterium]